MKHLLIYPICLLFFLTSCGDNTIPKEEFKQADLIILNEFQIEEEFQKTKSKIHYQNNACYVWTQATQATNLYKFDGKGELIFKSIGLPFNLGSIHYRDQQAFILKNNELIEVDLVTGDLISRKNLGYFPKASCFLNNSLYFLKEIKPQKEYEIIRRDLDNFEIEIVIGRSSLENPDQLYDSNYPNGLNIFETSENSILYYFERIKEGDNDHINIVLTDLENGTNLKKIKLHQEIGSNSNVTGFYAHNILTAKDRIFLNSSKWIKCIDPIKQEVIWDYEGGYQGDLFGNLTYLKNENLLLCYKYLYKAIAIDIDSGTKKWENENVEGCIYCNFTYNNQKIYYAGKEGIGVVNAHNGTMNKFYTLKDSQGQVVSVSSDDVVIEPAIMKAFILNKDNFQIALIE